MKGSKLGSVTIDVKGNKGDLGWGWVQIPVPPQFRPRFSPSLASGPSGNHLFANKLLYYFEICLI